MPEESIKGVPVRHPASTEPCPAALGGSEPLRIAKRLFLATRPMFFPASVLPVLLGTAWGYRVAGHVDWLAFGLALAAVVGVHAGANVLNDVYDALSGADEGNDARVFPFTGGSRFIQNGVMSVGDMARWGGGLLIVSVVPGGLLVIDRGLGVLAFGLGGLALAVLYSAPPLRLAARGLGEATVGAAFGVLPVVGAAWLQSGRLDANALLMSVPVSLWVANILLINEIPDAAADRAAGKRTLAVRLGKRGTDALYLASNLLAALVVGAVIVRGLLPVWAGVGSVVLLGLAVGAAITVLGGPSRARLRYAIEATLAIHALGTLWLIAWVAVTS